MYGLPVAFATNSADIAKLAKRMKRKRTEMQDTPVTMVWLIVIAGVVSWRPPPLDHYQVRECRISRGIYCIEDVGISLSSHTQTYSKTRRWRH